MIVISSIYQKFVKTSLELYGWQFNMEEIPRCITYLPTARLTYLLNALATKMISVSWQPKLCT